MSADLPHIAITGRARSGKDTAAKALIALGWQRVAFADGVREMAYAIDPNVITTGGATYRLTYVVSRIGWDAAKEHDDVRRFLQRLGTEGVRDHLGRHAWIDLAMRKATAASVFTDARFPNEADAIRTAGGIVVRIVRPGVEAVAEHISETAMDAYPVDAEIVNDGTAAQLEAKVVTVCSGLFAERNGSGSGSITTQVA